MIGEGEPRTWKQSELWAKALPSVALQSLTGDPVAASYSGGSQTYNIQDGKIVTSLVGTPIETTVYKVGEKYLAARNNEFGYANYEIIPAVAEIAPVR
jgi:hypothetical protein